MVIHCPEDERFALARRMFACAQECRANGRIEYASRLAQAVRDLYTPGDDVVVEIDNFIYKFFIEVSK